MLGVVLALGPRELLVIDDMPADPVEPVEVDTACGDDTVEIGRGPTRVDLLFHEVLCATG